MTGTADRIARFALVIFIAGLCAPARRTKGEGLEPKTLAAFDQYVRRAEAQTAAWPARDKEFLWVERLSGERRATAERQLWAGQVVIERVAAQSDDAQGGRDKPVIIPGGMIHHWIGTVFISGASLAQTLALEQDYNHHQEYFHPEVMRSKILGHEGNDFRIEMRLYKKKLIATVLDTEHQVHYEIVDSTHAWSRSRTIRIQEVDKAGEPNERLEPVGHDRGFLWRMNNYWRFEEKNGGTYVECQSISLTRDVPGGLGWLMGPYLTGVPRESLTFMLATTRSRLLEGIARGER